MSENLRDKYLRCRPACIGGEVDAKRLQADLLRYIELAKELGASAGAALDREALHLDPRVRLKCAVPRCTNYGACGNCPPHSPAAEETAAWLRLYSKGVLLRWEYVPETSRAAGTELRRALYSALAKIEAAAFYDGYYFACAFGAGSCRRGLCGEGPCQELTEPYKGCRFPLLARPSMEAAGFDVYKTAASAGWRLNPAGGQCPETLSSLSRIALVLVA